MGCRQKMEFTIFTCIMIALASKREFLVNATENSTGVPSWVGSKYQIECTMCAACDNPCNTPSPPPPLPPSPPPPPPSSSSNCPPPPSPPSSGSNYYSPPPPSQSGSYPYSSPPPPSGIIGSYYPPTYKSYPSGPTPPPPNPIVPYFPFYYYSPPPPSISAAVQLESSTISFLITIFVSVFMVSLK